jgi:amino acid transporter
MFTTWASILLLFIYNTVIIYRLYHTEDEVKLLIFLLESNSLDLKFRKVRKGIEAIPTIVATYLFLWFWLEGLRSNSKWTKWFSMVYNVL